MRRVLVTGAAGFLGRAVCDAVRATGAEPVGVDTRPGPDVTALDVRRPDALDGVLQANGTAESPDSVIHLVATGKGHDGLVAGASAQPAQAVRVNVEGFVNLVDAAARNGVRRVVWASSTMVYGPAAGYPDRPIDEGAALRPTTVYGATKAACEHLAPILSQSLGVEVVALRLPMVYGPGRWYGGSLQPLVELVNALREHAPATVDVWTGEADWVHGDDAAAALVALTRTPYRDHAYHVVGHRGGLADLASALIEAAPDRRAVKLRMTEHGAPDLPAIDDGALRRDMEFVPRYPDARAGARSYLLPESAPPRT